MFHESIMFQRSLPNIFLIAKSTMFLSYDSTVIINLETLFIVQFVSCKSNQEARGDCELQKANQERGIFQNKRVS